MQRDEELAYLLLEWRRWLQRWWWLSAAWYFYFCLPSLLLCPRSLSFSSRFWDNEGTENEGAGFCGYWFLGRFLWFCSVFSSRFSLSFSSVSPSNLPAFLPLCAGFFFSIPPMIFGSIPLPNPPSFQSNSSLFCLSVSPVLPLSFLPVLLLSFLTVLSLLPVRP